MFDKLSTEPGRRARSSCLVVLLCLGGCGGAEDRSPELPPPSSTAEKGAAASADQSRQATLESLRDDTLRVLSLARQTLDREALDHTALLSGRVSIEPGVARLSLRYRLARGAGPRVAFTVPANAPAWGRTPPVQLERVEVDGRPATAEGTSARWEIPVPSGDDPVVAISLEVRVAVPDESQIDQKVELDRELDQLPALAHLLPDYPNLPHVGALGGGDAFVTLAGAFPVFADGRRAAFDVVVSTPGDASEVVLGTGLRLEPERAVNAGVALRETRFVGLSAELALLWVKAGEQERFAVSGREVTIAVERSSASETSLAQARSSVEPLLRRGFDAFEGRWGRLESPGLSILVTSRFTPRGATSLPGILILPASIGVSGAADSNVAPSAGQAPPTNPRPALDVASGNAAGGGAPIDWGARLAGLLAHHPAPREAFQRATLVALARQWWAGSGEGTSLVLELGLASEGALGVLRSMNGDKAARRALELGWRLPYQLGRMRGAQDPALVSVGPGLEPSVQAIAFAKAGLAFETLARTLGAEPFDAFARALRTEWARAPYGGPSSEEVLRLFERHAPRPEIARAVWGRWLNERRADGDVGELRPGVLLEYLVSDGAVVGLSRALLDNAPELADTPLGKRALATLGSGESLDTGFAVALLGELLGPNLDPASRRWLELGTGLFSREGRKGALSGLIEELATELGVPESERRRLELLGGMVLDALDAPKTDTLPAEDAPAEAP